MKYKGVSTAIISETLGHESESTTQDYLAEFDRQVIDDMHEEMTA